jgi:Winged helix-turn helix
MQGRHAALRMALDDPTRAILQGWLRKQQTPVGLATRARAMLLWADGQTFAATARHVELRERHVRQWALRFVASGSDGLYDKKRPGRQPVFSPGGRGVCGQAGVCTPRGGGAVAVAGGERSTGPAVGP